MYVADTTAPNHQLNCKDYELVRIYHPDRRRADSVPAEMAHSQFQAISSAYNVLRERFSTYSPSADSTELADVSAANWRAIHILRRRKLYEGGDDRWKDRLILGGLVFVRHSSVA